MKNLKIIFFILIAVLLLSFQIKAEQIIKISLRQAADEALKNNDLLQVSSQEVQIILAQIKKAKANFLPNIDANVIYSRLDIVPGFKKELLGNIENDFLTTISIRQPIYTGGKLTHEKKKAVAALESQKFSFQNDRLTTKLATVLLYYQLIKLNNKIQILRENQQQLKKHEQFSRLLVQSGHMSEIELNRIKVESAQVEGNLLSIKNDFTIISNDLSVLMGRIKPATFFPSDSLKISPLGIGRNQLLPTALKNNPSLSRYSWDIQQARSNIFIKKAARYPQISALIWYGYEFGLKSFSPVKNDRYFLGFTARIPISDGGVIKANISQAELRLKQTRKKKDYFLKKIRAQLTKYYLKLEEMKELSEIQEQAVEQAKKTYRLALIEYHAGRRSNTDLLDIQRSLIKSKLILNDAVVNYNKSKAELLYILGIL